MLLLLLLLVVVGLVGGNTDRLKLER